MKKVININFQGRVIPIEEAAYDLLQKYVDSLRLFFANEEGRDEIINDIEGRIAELFGETLKNGSTCITEDDVNKIINSMGRPEDFDEDEAKVHSQLGGDSGKQRSYSYEQRTNEPKRLYRDENHKIVAGVCSGIANYIGIDPVVARIVAIVFFGVVFIPYLILWVAIPSTASTMIGSQRKRLFRDADNKLIAGVCSGLASYFSINVWIPRFMFLIPFISFAFNTNHWGFWDFPQILSLSFSPGSLFIYIVFWLILPEAKSAADKLEMKGEKVDLNNIKTTIQGDLDGFKDRAQQFGNEMKEKAQEFGESLGKKGKQFAGEAEPLMRRGRRNLGDIIVLIAKIFAYFIVGCVLFAVVVSLFSLGVAFTSLLPAKNYVIRDGWQNLFAWGALILFIWVPVVGIVTWIIRRLAKKRGNSTFIRSVFLALWVAGLFCAIGLVTSLVRDFNYKNNPVEQPIALDNPKVKKLEVRMPNRSYFKENWLQLEPFASIDEDSVFARNIRLRIVKSSGDSFQVTMVKLTNGRTKQEADEAAARINFKIRQYDTTLFLDKGILITPNEKFRNQQIIVTIGVPVGKRILIKEGAGWNWGSGMNVHLGMDADNYYDWESTTDSKAYDWSHDEEYIMTQTGLDRVNKEPEDNTDENSNDENSGDAIEQYRKSKEDMEREKARKLKELEEIDRELQKSTDTSMYHYQPVAPKMQDTTPVKKVKEPIKNTAYTNTKSDGITDILMMKYEM